MILWYRKIDFVISQNRYHKTVKWYCKLGFVILQTPYDFYIEKLRDNIGYHKFYIWNKNFETTQ